MRVVRIAVMATMVSLFAGRSEAALITFNDLGGAEVGTDVRSVFEEAAAIWEGILKDDVTIRIDLAYTLGGAGGLAGTAQVFEDKLLGDVETALLADATSATDATATANLPIFQFGGFRTMSFTTTNAGDGTPFFDSGRLLTTNSGNNRTLKMTRANLKALGLATDDGTADAAITVNSYYDAVWDFDRSDGISATEIDLLSTALHEVGHVLGFTSGVTQLDQYSAPNGTLHDPNANYVPIFSALDLFRYSYNPYSDIDFNGDGVVPDNLDRDGDGVPDPDLRVGPDPSLPIDPNDTAYWDNYLEPYFSIDGGVTRLGDFATGKYNGDGTQSSHWKRNLAGPEIGIMGGAEFGEVRLITGLDLTAFDAIGWDLEDDDSPVVPEPGTLALVGAAAAVALYLRRRRG